MSFTHCRVWDGQTMHYLNNLLFESEDFFGVWLEDAAVLINRFNPQDKRRYEPTRPWRLMQSIGQFDRHETLIFDWDIVDCQGERLVVRTDSERCGYSLFLPYAINQPPAIFLDRNLARSLTVLGNCFEDPDLLAAPHRLAA
ncbi:YopX family protein [Larkinella insperata]|uniref:YopX family protein n=1 Tax=Larkinella insperata TaxID=332158 RepID=A0ABW3Q5R9_9BACT|nr:YopX family protein [Larkinella insperata]